MLSKIFRPFENTGIGISTSTSVIRCKHCYTAETFFLNIVLALKSNFWKLQKIPASLPKEDYSLEVLLRSLKKYLELLFFLKHQLLGAPKCFSRISMRPLGWRNREFLKKKYLRRSGTDAITKTNKKHNFIKNILMQKWNLVQRRCQSRCQDFKMAKYSVW